jgi:1-aminocyclopropane-1-carboxylate deaminase/D-cysteine desulfhydrase-like pyridoxal-dependent ACC family enzyme
LTQKRHYQEDDDTAFYLKYKSLEDMLKIIIYSSQSMLGTTPMLYDIVHNDRQILFIQTGGIIGAGSVIVHYTIQTLFLLISDHFY